MLSMGPMRVENAPGRSPAGPQPRLVSAAHEFEAQMMTEILKPLSSSNSWSDDDGDADLGATGALGEFGAEALGRGLSEHGGLGIATSIIHSLSHQGRNSAT
jgi:hypothetical protein